jgi:hypothetical protein
VAAEGPVERQGLKLAERLMDVWPRKKTPKTLKPAFRPISHPLPEGGGGIHILKVTLAAGKCHFATSLRLARLRLARPNFALHRWHRRSWTTQVRAERQLDRRWVEHLENSESAIFWEDVRRRHGLESDARGLSFAHRVARPARGCTNHRNVNSSAGVPGDSRSARCSSKYDDSEIEIVVRSVRP